MVHRIKIDHDVVQHLIRRHAMEIFREKTGTELLIGSPRIRTEVRFRNDSLLSCDIQDLKVEVHAEYEEQDLVAPGGENKVP